MLSIKTFDLARGLPLARALRAHLAPMRRVMARLRSPVVVAPLVPTLRIPRLELSPFLRDLVTAASKRRPEAERLAAAQRLVEEFERPVHAARWAGVRAAIEADARAAGRSFEEELQIRCVSAVFDVLPELDELHLDELELGLQRALGRAITEDALGPGWRQKYLTEKQRKARRPEEVALEAAADVGGAAPGPSDELEARQLLEAVRLSAREAELVAALLIGLDQQEFARGAGLSDSTARTLRERARKKFRGV